MTRVSLLHLSHEYDPASGPAVDDLTLEIPSGRVTALLGPSGSGKSTTLKMIAGLLRPARGDIRFDGESVRSLPPERRAAAMVFQNHLLFPFLSIADNIGFGLRMRGLRAPTIHQRVDEMLEVVQLPGLGGRKPDELSGGQAQRVALARALIVQPRVLLLDEPLSNLDAHLRDEMRDLVLEVQRRFSITTIVVTHDQQEAVVLADQVALLFDGRLAQWGAARTLFERPESARVARFFGGVNFLQGTREGAHVHTDLGEFHAPGGDAQGSVTLTIRPEHVQVGDLSTQDRPNHFPAELVQSLYRGSDTRLRLRSGPHTIEVIAPAAQADTLKTGERVALHFPPQSIWVITEND